MAKKKTTTKKTTIKKTTPSRSSSRSTPSPARTPPARPVAVPDLPKPPAAPAVPIEDYVHMGKMKEDFCAMHPGSVVMQLDDDDRSTAESSLASLADDTPILVCTRQLPGAFTATDLENLGFLCFYNGKGGQLVGTKVK